MVSKDGDFDHIEMNFYSCGKCWELINDRKHKVKQKRRETVINSREGKRSCTSNHSTPWNSSANNNPLNIDLHKNYDNSTRRMERW